MLCFTGSYAGGSASGDGDGDGGTVGGVAGLIGGNLREGAGAAVAAVAAVGGEAIGRISAGAQTVAASAQQTMEEQQIAQKLQSAKTSVESGLSTLRNTVTNVLFEFFCFSSYCDWLMICNCHCNCKMVVVCC